MWQTFKSNSVDAVLTREIKKRLEMSFQFRIQFCSTPWTHKIPKSQKCARLEEVRYSLQGYRARHKKIILTAMPNPWRTVYPKSGLLLFLLNLSGFSLKILKSQMSCNSDNGANVHKMMWGIWFTANTQLLHSTGFTSRKPHCQSISRTCLTRNIKRNPNNHCKMARDT